MTSAIAGIAAAQARVDGIRDNLGYPSQEYLDDLNDTQRQGLFKLLRRKDELIGASVVSLAKSLYTSKARFVFELLQNAEDNHYSKAFYHSEKPQVTFHVHHDRVIQECNEDGFNEANLTAICNIGKSSKTTSQTYIGEKGIGFKSVFMVAYKAYIQSGDFSFFFEHHPKDVGMGMIAPQWQETTERLGDRLTRITLFLHKDGTAEDLAKQNKMIRNQFEQIHEAILLFMSKIKEIKIVFYLDDGELEKIEKTVIFSVEYSSPKTTVKKTTTENGQITEEVKHYFVSTCLVTGLAKNENRNYSDEDNTSQSYSKSNVTLAFPLTSTHEPLLDMQWVFAYLPTCRMGFKFLIQADFVTQANREGIVATSARNESLMLGIAHAFIQAIKAMREVPSLRFTWMRYLPKKEDYPWDDTWSKLINNIGDLLQTTRILESAHETLSLKLIKNSRQHTNIEMDEHGRPLLPDKEPNLYLSHHYQGRDLQILRDFGLSYTTMNEILERAKWDLEQPISRIKIAATNGVQSRIAKLLTIPFNRKWLERQNEVRQLKMLRLREDIWCMSFGNSVYFSRIEETELDIPDGLGWNVLDSSVELSHDMKNLYKLIGVKQASVSEIRKAIADRHSFMTPSLLQFLYLTHHLSHDHDIYKLIQLYTSDNTKISPASTRMYIRDRSPYSAARLLQTTEAGEAPGNGAPGYKVAFLHLSYFRNVPKQPTEQILSWKEWLHQILNIARTLPLLNDDKTGVSGECIYLARHRPDIFLHFLKSTWDTERPQCQNEDDIVEELLDVEVVCQRGDGEMTIVLRDAYLPLEKFTGLCNRFLLDGEFFPFLKLASPLSHGTSPGEWETLGDSFGLGYRQDDMVGFLLDVVNAIVDADSKRDAEPRPERIYDFYLYLQAECRQSHDYEASCEKIRRSILKYHLFIPGDNIWDEPDFCVWEAPNGLELHEKYSLTERFSYFSEKFEADKPLFADFFINTLKITRTCTWQDLVDEVKYLKSKGEGTFDRMHKLYECIVSMDLDPQERNQLKAIFAREGLVYDNTGGLTKWHETSRCLWSSAVNIRGMFAVNSLYEDLKPFFVRILGVQTRTVGMVYKKLAEGTENLDVDDVKNTLEVFSVLLESEDSSFDPKPVLENKVFPVISPTGQSELRTAFQDFAIRDRRQLSDDFENKAWFLDFDMTAVRRLQAFIDWAGLQKRYISTAVKEIASVDISSTRPICRSAFQIKEKAHALTRIAVTFNSPRLNGSPSGLYTIFQASETLETDKITSQFILNQGVPPISVEKESAMLYIPDHASELKVYLTSDEIQQESCFNSKLPRRLAQWIMSEPDRPSLDPVSPQMVSAVQSVLSVSRRALPTVLDEHGIVTINLIDEEEGLSLPLRTRETSAVTTTHATATYPSSRSSSHIAPIYTPPPYSDASPPPSDATRGQTYSVTQTIDGSWRPTVPVFEVASPSTERYSSLLSHVVGAARRYVFPAYYGDADSESSEAEDYGAPNAGGDRFALRSYQKLERDIRVGAAGELFVFELLSNLHPPLPGFARQNWKSNIRHYVSGHQDYANIQRWSGRETSDIVYNDSTGVLTNLLISEGYLDRETWEDEIIEYYLEVKTTTGESGAPFFMSNPQYERMRDYSVGTPAFWSTKKLYVIFRVYNLTEESVSVKVLVDPATMEDSGLVSFTADTWSGVIN